VGCGNDKDVGKEYLRKGTVWNFRAVKNCDDIVRKKRAKRKKRKKRTKRKKKKKEKKENKQREERKERKECKCLCIANA